MSEMEHVEARIQTINPIDIESWAVSWLSKKYKTQVDTSTPLFNNLINSLGFLELLAACAEDMNLRISIDTLKLDNLKSVGSFIAATAKVAIPDEPRIWYEVSVFNIDNHNRTAVLLGLRSRLPQSTIIRICDDNGLLRVGIPSNVDIKRAEILQIIELLVGDSI